MLLLLHNTNVINAYQILSLLHKSAYFSHYDSQFTKLLVHVTICELNDTTMTLCKYFGIFYPYSNMGSSIAIRVVQHCIMGGEVCSPNKNILDCNQKLVNNILDCNHNMSKIFIIVHPQNQGTQYANCRDMFE